MLIPEKVIFLLACFKNLCKVFYKSILDFLSQLIFSLVSFIQKILLRARPN